MPGLTEPNQTLRREDLANMLINVEAEDFPLFSIIPKGAPVKATFHEWGHDAYAPVKMGGVPDGKDVETFDDKSQRRRRIKGRIQKFRDSYGVGDIAENVSEVAGVPSEVSKSKMDSLYELKRNIEVQLGSDDDSNEDDGVDGSVTRGLGSWISASAQSDLPVPSDYRSRAAQIDTTAMASVSESTINGVLDQLYTNRKKRSRYLGVVGTALKSAISDLTKYDDGVSASVAAIRTFNQDGASKKIVATIDFYEGDTGQLELSLSSWLGYTNASGSPVQAHGDKRGYVLDIDKVEICPNRHPRHKPLEDKGGGPRGYWDALYLLKVLSPLCHGKFAATS